MQYRDCLLFCELRTGALYAQRKFPLPQTGICSLYSFNSQGLALQTLPSLPNSLGTNRLGIIKDFYNRTRSSGLVLTYQYQIFGESANYLWRQSDTLPTTLLPPPRQICHPRTTHHSHQSTDQKIQGCSQIPFLLQESTLFCHFPTESIPLFYASQHVWLHPKIKNPCMLLLHRSWITMLYFNRNLNILNPFKAATVIPQMH